MNNDNNTSTPPTQTPSGTDPQGQTPNTPQGQTPQGSNQRTALDSLPSDVQELITKLREENKQRRQALDAHEAARQQAEEQKLKEQGEFQKLAEQHAARVKELEPIQERYSTLAELVHDQIKEQVKTWPDEVKSLLPGKDTPVEERLKAVERMKPLAEKIAQQQRGMAPGNSPNPKPAQGQTPDDARTDFYNRLRTSGKYGA